MAHPYVHELRYEAASGVIRVRTTTLLGNNRWAGGTALKQRYNTTTEHEIISICP